MQESNHQERLLAKFIKFCEWLCKEHPGRATPALKLVCWTQTKTRPLDGEEVTVIFFIVV